MESEWFDHVDETGVGGVKAEGRSTSQTWKTKMWIILFQTCRVQQPIWCSLEMKVISQIVHGRFLALKEQLGMHWMSEILLILIWKET
jgi:hypothetical protein